MRCFFGIPLPQELKDIIYNQISKFKISGKKVEKENLHITIKFLGEISEEDFEENKKFLDSVVIDKIDININGVGTFGNPARVLFLNVDGDFEQIKGIFGLDDSFHPHITIARYKSFNDKIKSEIMNIVGNLSIDYKFTAQSIVLYESKLKETGPIYKVKFEKCLI
ncbi:MAG: RNA 2',3'-cyclic phosphodiesterase [bacterium]|nr:RNA 2',3'-cyclic phosphodiesterase [bacterium]